jgi:hypothetical protein
MTFCPIDELRNFVNQLMVWCGVSYKFKFFRRKENYYLTH